MADLVATSWQPRGGLHGVSGEHRLGRTPGVHAAALENLGLASIIVRRDAPPDIASSLTCLLGVEPPTTPRMARGRDADLIWSGPSQWLYLSRNRGQVEPLAATLAGIAAVADQSDSRAVLRVSGPNIRDVLAKGCLIDLHPRAFTTGDAALTSIAHIGVHLWQRDDAPTYDLAVVRSMAASFWSWFAASAAEYGCEFVASDGRG